MTTGNARLRLQALGAYSLFQVCVATIDNGDAPRGYRGRIPQSTASSGVGKVCERLLRRTVNGSNGSTTARRSPESRTLDGTSTNRERIALRSARSGRTLVPPAAVALQ
jgi:hypothetical protein